MNGPQHYKEAERLLEECDYRTSTDTLAAAQVHATLALAAAQIDTVPMPGTDPLGNRLAWIEATR